MTKHEVQVTISSVWKEINFKRNNPKLTEEDLKVLLEKLEELNKFLTERI